MAVPPVPPLPREPDVIVVGGGVIGLSIAFEAVSAGLRVDLIDAARPGVASLAAAGLLAPSLGTPPPDIHRLFIESARAFDDFCARVSEASARDVRPAWGLIEIARGAAEVAELAARHSSGARRIGTAELTIIEPAVADADAAWMHDRDGWMDPASIVEALYDALARSPAFTVVTSEVVRIDRGARPALHLADGSVRRASRVVVAAGAWSAAIGGLRPLPVEPARGQLLRVRSDLRLTHGIAGAAGYLVPRADGTIVVGSTLERVGFAPHTTRDGLAALSGILTALSPGIARSAVPLDSWAGLRPMTPDRLPIIGPDPECPTVVYATGHGKNGLLLTPLTSNAVLNFLLDRGQSCDLTPFSPTRFM
jgi:glycine oxidase